MPPVEDERPTMWAGLLDSLAGRLGEKDPGSGRGKPGMRGKAVGYMDAKSLGGYAGYEGEMERRGDMRRPDRVGDSSVAFFFLGGGESEGLEWFGDQERPPLVEGPPWLGTFWLTSMLLGPSDKPFT